MLFACYVEHSDWTFPANMVIQCNITVNMLCKHNKHIVKNIYKKPGWGMGVLNFSMISHVATPK